MLLAQRLIVVLSLRDHAPLTGRAPQRRE